MALTASRPEELEETQRFLRAEVRAPTTEVRNVAIATEINTDSYFSFKGVTYKVPPLSYRIGVQLQEVHLEIEKLARAEDTEKQLADMPREDQVAHLQQLLVCYETSVALFHSACFPLSFWRRWGYHKRNPFADSSTQEIGELLGFFFLCRMKSRVDLVGSLALRPSLSIKSTPVTT